MGGYYAREANEPEVLGMAIREHYLPTQQGTLIPSTREGQVLALADKLDALAGIFAIGQKPTASKDPFALRRAANGVLRICIEGELPLDISALLLAALDAQPAGKKDAAIHAELVEFVMERLRALLVTGDVTSEMFEAVKATGITVPLDFAHRIEALKTFVALPASANLAAAHKRIRNILKQAGDVSATIDPTLFEHDTERALFAAMNALQLDGDYASQLAQLATLREPVDAFMDARNVNGEPLKVLDPDPAVRNNRLALLTQLDKLCRSVADISLLPGT
jgi:glycyl-tRNA synthetase beta chain